MEPFTPSSPASPGPADTLWVSTGSIAYFFFFCDSSLSSSASCFCRRAASPFFSHNRFMSAACVTALSSLASSDSSTPATGSGAAYFCAACFGAGAHAAQLYRACVGVETAYGDGDADAIVSSIACGLRKFVNPTVCLPLRPRLRHRGGR